MSFRSALTVEALTPEAAARHQAEWQRLADDCLEPNVFLTPGFALAAARHLSGRAAPVFLCVWDASVTPRRLVGLCPIAAPGRFGSWLPRRLWTHEQAPLGTPLLAKDCAVEALAALLAYGREHFPGGLMFPMLPRDGAVANLLTTAATAEHRALYVFGAHRRAVLAGGPDPQTHPHEALSSHRRRNLKRSRRLLETQGAVTVGVSRSGAELKAATSAFLALEAKGWKGRRGTAFAQTPARAGFAQDALDALGAHENYFIVSLTLAGAPIAMGLVLKSNDRAFWWKVAYDEAYAIFSPGVLLALELTSILLKDETIALTDSCASADHPMIDHLWPERMAIGDVFVAFTPQDESMFAALVQREALYRSLRGKVKDAVGVLRRLKQKLNREH